MHIVFVLLAAYDSTWAAVPGDCWGLGGAFGEALPDIKAATVVGSSPAFLLDFSSVDCRAVTTGCKRLLDPLKPGDRIVVTSVSDGYMCVTPARRKQNNLSGWLAQNRVKLVDPTQAIAPLSAWAGTWRDGSTKIKLRRRKTGLTVYGDAAFQEIYSTHFGEINDVGTPSGNVLRVGESEGCEVEMLLFADTLVVEDNTGCGGTNVTFSGTYRHTSR